MFPELVVSVSLSEPFLALIGGILAALVTAFLGFFSWLVLRYFSLKSEIESLEQRVRGDSQDSHDSGLVGETRDSFSRVMTRLENLSDCIEDLEESQQEQHRQVMRRTGRIITVLKHNDINGDLPGADYEEGE